MSVSKYDPEKGEGYNDESFPIRCIVNPSEAENSTQRPLSHEGFLQALEALVRLERNNQLRNGVSYEIANSYLVEFCNVDRGKYRTVITISLAPPLIDKTKGED